MNKQTPSSADNRSITSTGSCSPGFAEKYSDTAADNCSYVSTESHSDTSSENCGSTTETSCALERMQQGLIYDPGDENILSLQSACLEKLYDFNHTRPSEAARRSELLKEMLGSMGKGCYIEPPFHANWGGRHLFLGSHVYANFNLTIVDDGNIFIDDSVMIGPNVTLATANHPIHPALREKAMQYNKDIHIGRNVWIGAGAVLVPGVHIGENTVIGAGSIVTKDIPANVVACGNPCRVLRSISEHDQEYFYKNEKIDWENL